ncbi:MAG TPA: Tm-1-like ATP-binding domain-containing protein [Kaistia sp.]|nr:Tm-1-like ATP-binding domain-containing protein [Kaistia sp.]
MSAAEPFVLIAAALDTKGEEAAFLKARLEASGLAVRILDFGVLADAAEVPDYPAALVAGRGGADLAVLRASRDRAAAIDAMMAGSARIAADLQRTGQLAGVLSIGGSGGTAVGTAMMRALPLGVPKVMVSTVAASNVLPYVGGSDIAMLNSVTDFSGVNALSAPILANAAGALAGMIAARRQPASLKRRPLVAASMFGVTTPAVEHCRVLLAEAGYELVPFHATGIGGRTMEALIAEGHFAAVLDLTTTEWADEVVGGTLSAGPTRLEAAGRAGLPQLVAPGALDMVNFFGPGAFPDRFEGRLIHRYNDNVVLMRTTAAENAEIGRRIAEKLNAAKGPVAVLLPLKGVSAMDAEGGRFFDPDADAALFAALRAHLGRHVLIETIDAHINEPVFAARCVARLLALIAAQGEAHAQSHAG